MTQEKLKIKALLPGIISILFLAIMLISPESSYKAALSGLHLWFNVVFPSLLPFFIISEFISGIGVVDFIAVLLNPLMKPIFGCPGSSSFIWAMSAISGYPSSARLVSLFIEKKKITPVEGQRILSFTSTSGPLFMIGAVAIGMLGSLDAGIAIILGHYTSAIILGFAFRFYKVKDSKDKNAITGKSLKTAYFAFVNARKNDGRTIGELLGDSVRNSVNILLMVGGFIVFFSVIIDRLRDLNITGILTMIAPQLWIFKNFKSLNSNILNGLIGGFIEITSGCRMISEAYVPLAQKTAAISFLIGWSGLSIHAQTASLLNKTGISLKLYFLTKLIHGIIASMISYISALMFFPSTIEAYNPPKGIISISPKQYFYMSGKLIVWSIFVIFALSIFILFLKNSKEYIARNMSK